MNVHEGMFNLPKFLCNHISPSCCGACCACCALHCLLSISFFLLLFLVFYSSKMLHCSKTSGCRIHHLEIRCLANSQQMLSKPWHRATSSGKARNLILGHNCNGLIRWKSRDSEPYVGALKTHAINEPTTPVAVCFNLFSERNTF